MAPVIAIVLCFASGYLLVALFLPRFAAWNIPLRLSFAVGVGLGVFSAEHMVRLAVGISHPWVIDLLVFALLLSTYVLIRPGNTARVLLATRSEETCSTRNQKILTVAFALALCAAPYAAITRSLVHLHGDGWDAFSIWNLHARFLFRGGAAWRDGFSPLIPWSHPDYPLLLPATIAHFWSYLGRESQAVPAVIGLVLTFSTVGLLFSSLAILRGRTSAMLGGLVLLATPFFLEQGTSQYADVPLSFFVLAAISTLCLYHHIPEDATNSRAQRLLVLSGLAAGFAAWTKNEGMLFLFALTAAQLLVHVRKRNLRNSDPTGSAEKSSARPLGLFFAGLAPLLILIFWFKHSVAPHGDLFPDTASAIHKLLEPHRYWIVFRWYFKSFFRFGEWWLVPGTLALGIYYFLMVGAKKDGRSRGFDIGLVTLSLTFAGYFVIYLITPYDIFWHLRNSLNRLFLQLWPSAVFLFFLAAPDSVQEIALSRNFHR
jgi:hypothetical protein